jgi:hypothetical protein
MLSLLSIVLFTYSWYKNLKLHSKRRILPQELRPKNEKITI